MDYYEILKISNTATPKEIEQAYQRLMKESRYNTSIDRKVIETAYRILSDSKTKQSYDTQKIYRGRKVEKRRKKTKIFEKLSKLTLTQLLQILIIVGLVTVGFYSFRFGHLMKHFQAGDTLYYNESNQELGRIIKVEANHSFGTATLDGYLIETAKEKRQIWIPQVDVKARCYKIEKK